MKEIIFCPLDLWRLFFKKLKKILIFSFIGSFILLLYLLSLPVSYPISATFKEMVDKDENWSVKEFFVGSFAINNYSQASTIMLSKQVLTPLVEELGLQANIQLGSNKISKFFKNCFENILAEVGYPLKDEERFVFKNVKYNDEKPLNLFISFNSENSFTIFDEDKKKIKNGLSNEPFQLNKLIFTLTRVPKNLILHNFYDFTILPTISLADCLSQKISIKSLKENRNVLLLTFKDRDRYRGANILNNLMLQYQKYLKKESDNFANEQLIYLKKRQMEMNENLNSSLDEYENYLSKNVKDKGFFTLGHEMDTLLSPHNKYNSQLFDLELEIANLQNLKKNPNFYNQEGELGKIENDLAHLKNEKDLLSLSLLEHAKTLGKNSLDKRLEKIDMELKKLQKNEISSLLDPSVDKLIQEKQKFIEEKESLALASDFDWVKDKNKRMISVKEKREKYEALLLKVKNDEKDLGLNIQIKDPSNKRALLEYLENFIYLLKVQEKSIDSCFFSTNLDLNGLDLDTSRHLYLTNISSLEGLKNDLEKISHVKEKLKIDDLEISSLSTILNDPVSNSILNKAATLILEMQDKKNRSDNDFARMKEELAIQKKFLALHLDELLDLNLLSQRLTVNKIEQLRKVLLNLLNQQISLLDERSQRLIDTKIAKLKEEKSLLLDKNKEIQEKMEELPLRWKSEKLLQLKTDLSMKMMQTTANLLESKSIARQLHQVLSKPLDLAIVPLQIKPPKLRLFFVIFFLFFMILSFFFIVIKEALSGFTLSLEMLSFSHHTSGYLSHLNRYDLEYKKRDLQTLREMINFLTLQDKIISILSNTGSDYSFHLANLLSKSGKKILVIDSEDISDGFLQYLDKDTLPIRSQGEFDYLSMGNSSPFSLEIISSQKFKDILFSLENKYDHLIIFTKTSFNDQMGKVLLRLSDCSFVTIKNETIEDLKKIQTNSHLSFVAIS